MYSNPPGQMQPELAEMTAFSQAFEAWEATACVADFPYASVLALYHKLGKHFVPEPVTDCLIRAREAHVPAGGAPRLSAFLDCMLDKSDDRYDYASYCALELLELPCGDPVALTLDEIARERDMALLALLGDLVGFEWRALQGQESRLPQMRPDAALASKRVQRVLAAMRPSLLRLGCSSHALPGKIDVQGFLDWRQAVLPDECRTRMALSILPVHVVHDEYLFLRTLQAFEANFAWIAVLLRGALHALERDGESALESLEQANGYLRETARLFPLLGTMQIAAFHDFRRFTEGASAIQSAGYKKVEALCRRPDEERLNSIAYAAVPGIRDAVQNGQPTLEEVYARACARRHLSVAVLGKIEAQMGLFASQLLRWRQAHLQLARRFLGERGGTGYTEGVPYLASVKDIPVFRTVPARS